MYRKDFPSHGHWFGYYSKKFIPNNYCHCSVAQHCKKKWRNDSNDEMTNDNAVMVPAAWEDILALGNINHGNVDEGGTQRNNPNYRRRNDTVNYFAELTR